MINSPKVVSRPDANVVQEALNLLSVLGKGEANPLLTEMLKVQKHNEKVYADAVDMKKRAEDFQKLLNDDVDKLVEEQEDFKEWSKSKTSEINKIADQLKENSKKMDEKYKIDFADLKNRSNICEGRRETLEGMAEELEIEKAKNLSDSLKNKEVYEKLEEDTKKVNKVISQLKLIISGI